MKKLIICEGQTDSLFLTKLLEKQFQIIAGKINFSQSGEFSPDDKSSIHKELIDKSFVSEELKKDIVVLSCSGLDGIKLFLKNMQELPNSEFRKVPALLIWDEDPQNKTSSDKKKNIEEKFRVINIYKKPFVISGMLEELIITYLKKQIDDKKLTGYANEALLEKSIHCMDAYLKCLQAKNSHSKIRLDLLEKGILLQSTEKYDLSRQNLNNEDKIIPKVFENIDFEHSNFQSLVKAIENFIKAN